MTDIAAMLAAAGEDLARANAELAAALARVNKLYATTWSELTREERVTWSELTRESQRINDVDALEELDWSYLTLMGAAIRALRLIGRPADAHEVHRRVGAARRGDSYYQTRSALNYAARIGKLRRVGRGLFAEPDWRRHD